MVLTITSVAKVHDEKQRLRFPFLFLFNGLPHNFNPQFFKTTSIFWAFFGVLPYGSNFCFFTPADNLFIHGITRVHTESCELRLSGGEGFTPVRKADRYFQNVTAVQPYHVLVETPHAAFWKNISAFLLTRPSSGILLNQGEQKIDQPSFQPQSSTNAVTKLTTVTAFHYAKKKIFSRQLS